MNNATGNAMGDTQLLQLYITLKMNYEEIITIIFTSKRLPIPKYPINHEEIVKILSEDENIDQVVPNY